MLIEGAFPVAAPPQALMSHLLDAQLMASCLPGCEALERLDDDRYRAVVVIAMAGIKARFDLQVQITGRDERQVFALTRGEEGGRASMLQAESVVTLQAASDGTTVGYRSEVSVSGRLGRFALGMMKKKAQAMGDEFAANLRGKLEAAGAATQASAPVTGGPASSDETAVPSASEAEAAVQSASAAETAVPPAPEAESAVPPASEAAAAQTRAGVAPSAEAPAVTDAQPPRGAPSPSPAADPAARS